MQTWLNASSSPPSWLETLEYKEYVEYKGSSQDQAMPLILFKQTEGITGDALNVIYYVLL